MSDHQSLAHKVLAISWQFLDIDARRAVRAVSREGRVLYDRLWTRVRVTLTAAGEEGEPVGNLAPAALSASLTGAVARGCKPQEVVLSQYNDEDDFAVREQQALAVLTTLAGPSLTALSLHGYIALTPGIAAALSAAAAPALSRLTLEFPEPYEPEAHGRGHDAHAFAAVNLLMAAGPRLRSLELVRVDHWPTLVLQALAVCSSLEALSLDMGFPEDDPSAMADEAAMLRAVAAVTGLRSLTLRGGLSLTADDLQRHSSSLRCLSALTGLTSLSLQIAECHHREDSHSFEPSPQGRQRWGAAFASQRSALAAALRCMTGLRGLDCGGMQLRQKDLTALTALTCLKLGGVVLPDPPSRPDLAAAGGGGGGAAAGGGPQVGGAAGAAAAAAAAVGGGGGPHGGAPLPHPLVGSFALPPQLRELHFGRPPSPRQLAALHPPPSLTRIVTTRLAWEAPRAALNFNVRDVAHAAADGAAGGSGNRLLPDTPAVMAAAMAVLHGRVALTPLPPTPAPASAPSSPRATVPALGGTLGSPGGARRAATPPPRIAVVGCDSGSGRLQPPEGVPDGHACWLPALAALRVEELVLGDMALGLRDLLGLVERMPGLKLLDLRTSSFPMAALPCLAALPELEEVQISLKASPCAQETAEASLLLLFAHAAAARANAPGGSGGGGGGGGAEERGPPAGLQRVRIDRVQAPAWAMDAVRSVQALLAHKGIPGQLVV
ncbi:hypothetical protein HYH03_016924 [Edaphochlamys debaryana]|uniref:Uncharacterized protein n=1 Tax=Edaphochlamys debaryana TaxID=47281 RepID=A0A835XNQ5_9CHLO|nr:hypothetical protein HYH03_016924 [Edaphochlamys debaryana]|eukprot:KAG2484280.1 hypothetical protein HYH03_016924 [Edaphochlamys debaryana]